MTTSLLPAIPAKRYFVIGEVAELCGVKTHVLRYWEQEFSQPLKRRGNRRYYQHHEVLMVRKIRELLYDQGFTIQGARNLLAAKSGGVHVDQEVDALDRDAESGETTFVSRHELIDPSDPNWMRKELLAIQRILRAGAPQ
jgi:DNA-binding transcriptional MerR regulator